MIRIWEQNICMLLGVLGEIFFVFTHSGECVKIFKEVLFALSDKTTIHFYDNQKQLVDY